MDKVLLIDGQNSMYRACVKFGNPMAYQHQADDSIIFTFNFFRNLRAIIEELTPDKCFFALEGHPQFRYDLFPEYKANRIIKRGSRQENKEHFLKAKERILSLIKHLPITVVRAAHYEADDLIATLCHNMKDEDLTILTSDSDFIQLLQQGLSNLRIFNPIKKVDMEAPFYPYVAWKALNGDKSDNIPSLLKPKAALQAASNPIEFQKFMSVEENRANFSVNKDLIEFKMVPEEDIIWEEGEKNYPLLKEEFIQLQFESITNDKSWRKFTKTFDGIKY